MTSSSRGPIRSNPGNYLASLGLELRVQSERVRQLIGTGHWGHDGRHKEFLFKSVLERHLPAATVAAPGFVMDEDAPEIVSKEQDVLVVDTFAHGPLFNQGGLCVAFARQTLATTSIKTTPSRKTLEDAVVGLASVPASGGDPQSIWRAICFFEVGELMERPELMTTWLGDSVGGARPPVNLVCAGSDLAYRIDAPFGGGGWRVRAYQCSGVAQGLLIALLLSHIAAVRQSTSPLETYFEHVPFGQITSAHRDFPAS